MATNSLIPKAFDPNAWLGISESHRLAGTQATPNEYYSVGGTREDYSKNYGDTSWYDPDGGYTQYHPDYGLNLDAFHAAQREAEANKTQITPEKWLSFGGKQERYGNLYGNTNWYNPDGSMTQRHPDYQSSKQAEPETLFPEPVTIPETTIPTVEAPTYAAPVYEGIPVPEYEAAPKFAAEDYLTDYTQSEFYRWQKDQGLDDLNSMLAAEGLLGSGRAMDQRREFVTELNARESEAARQAAEQTANRANTWAQQAADAKYKWQVDEAERRFDTIIKDAELRNDFNLAEATRKQKENFDQAVLDADISRINAEIQNGNLEAAANRLIEMKKLIFDSDMQVSQETWDRIATILDLLMAQNPMQWASGGTTGLVDLEGQQGDAMQQFFNSISGGGGGGGGSGGGSSLLPPIPSSPNMSNTTPSQIVSSGSSNIGWGNLVTGLLSGLLGGSED